MAAMVTWSLLRELASFRAENGCATSLYLNLDPSDVPTAGDAQVRMHALLTAAAKPDRKDLTHDQGGSPQARYQRHIEKLVQEHLKGVAEELDRSRRRLHYPRIVLVSSEEMRSEFTDALSAEAREAIVGWTAARAQAGPAELLEAVTPILERAEAKDEAEAIERWREEAGRNGRASAGWEQTLEAASDARVERLLFQEGSDRAAWRGPRCGRAAASDGSCPLDGTRMEHV